MSIKLNGVVTIDDGKHFYISDITFTDASTQSTAAASAEVVKLPSGAYEINNVESINFSNGVILYQNHPLFVKQPDNTLLLDKVLDLLPS